MTKTFLLTLALLLVPASALAEEESGLSARVEAGGSLRTLYDVGYSGGTLEGGVGGRFGPLAGYATLSGFLGRTGSGLSARDLRIGVGVELGFLTIMRIGCGIHVGWLSFGTQTGAPALSTKTLGFNARLTADVIPIRDGALYLGIVTSADVLPYAPRASWETVSQRRWIPLAAGAQLGFRF